MQSLCIISVSVKNIGIQSRFAIFQSVTNQDNIFCLIFLIHCTHPPQSHKSTEDYLRRREEEKKLIYSHTPDRGY